MRTSWPRCYAWRKMRKQYTRNKIDSNKLLVQLNRRFYICIIDIEYHRLVLICIIIIWTWCLLYILLMSCSKWVLHSDIVNIFIYILCYTEAMLYYDKVINAYGSLYCQIFIKFFPPFATFSCPRSFLWTYVCMHVCKVYLVLWRRARCVFTIKCLIDIFVKPLVIGCQHSHSCRMICTYMYINIFGCVSFIVSYYLDYIFFLSL